MLGDVYKRQYVYGMLWEDDQGWNNNTTGDIFESIMGRRYLLETMQNEMTRAELVCQLIFCPPQISFLLEEWAREVYRLRQCIGWDKKNQELMKNIQRAIRKQNVDNG